jgi:hypothetical protein
MPFPSLLSFLSVYLKRNKMSITDEHHSVLKNDLRCGFNSTVANKTLSIKAGEILGFYVNYKAYGDSEYERGLYHPGPLTAYMGRVPEGKTAMDWDGSGLNVSTPSYFILSPSNASLNLLLSTALTTPKIVVQGLRRPPRQDCGWNTNVAKLWYTIPSSLFPLLTQFLI